VKIKIADPWQRNPWFESVAVAQARAKKRLPAPVYGALLAGSERGQTVADNEAAFDVLRMGIDSTLLGLGVGDVQDLAPEQLVVPGGFHRALGVEVPPTVSVGR
jgi:hypothetical protein